VIVEGLPIQLSADSVSVNFVAGSLIWSKKDQDEAPLGGATFEACLTIESECVTFLDNEDPDVNKSDGEFEINNLRLGEWTVQEISPPEGYNGDPGIREAVLTTDDPDFTFADSWVNIAFPGRILETGTTCEDYINGTAIELTEVIYQVKKELINNTAPGVFFYFTTFYAPGSEFTVEVDQVTNPAFEDFSVQNESNVRLFNGDCSMPSVTYTVTTDFINDPGHASVHIQGAADQQVFILSVKYDTGSVVGLTPLSAPPPDKYATIQYDYWTVIGEDIVDGDSDGVKLVPR
jgi:hypothetical protein